MINKVMLLGRLGKNPELKYSAANFPFCNFSLATDERVKGKDGTAESKTEWHNIVTLGKTAENCGKYLAKGSLVFVEGKIQTRKWQDKEGNDRYSTEIIAQNVKFAGSKKPEDEVQERTIPADIPAGSFDDDDIPF